MRESHNRAPLLALQSCSKRSLSKEVVERSDFLNAPLQLSYCHAVKTDTVRFSVLALLET